MGEIEIRESDHESVHIKVGEDGEPISSPREIDGVTHKLEDYTCGDSPGNLDIIDKYPASDKIVNVGGSNGCVEKTFRAAVVEIYEPTGGCLGSYESKGYGLYVD